jgi:hypothetical protein
MKMDEMKSLEGRIIEQVFLNEDQSIILFKTEKKDVAFITDGECCSESWFSDIEGANALIGGKVESAEEISMDGYNVTDGRCREDNDEVYGEKITTDKGVATVVMRNSSNGYYGAEPLSAATPDEIERACFTEITEDYPC